MADLLLGFQLPVFARRAQRELASHPKFYCFNAGVFRATLPRITRSGNFGPWPSLSG